MTGDPQPGDLNRVQEYKRLVLAYEALDEQVDALMARHQGASDSMAGTDLDHYRELSRRRDEVYNQLKELEQQILLDDENG